MFNGYKIFPRICGHFGLASKDKAATGIRQKRRLRLICAAAAGVCSILATSAGFGEGRISVGNAASARINLQVTIPNVIALQVGNPGSSVDTLSWESTIEVSGTTINLADQDWDGTTPDTPTEIDTSVGTNTNIRINGAGNRWRARVRVYALGGDVTIASSASNGDFLVNPDGHTIALSNIDVRSPGRLRHPDALNGGSSTILANGAGIVRQNAWWRYRLTTSSVLASGTYQSTITYTATLL